MLCRLNSRVAIQKRLFSSGAIFSPDYAFEMAASSVRFGRGATKEIGQDLVALGLTKRVCVVTDPYMATLPPMKAVLDSLVAAGVSFEVFDQVAVEPTCSLTSPFPVSRPGVIPLFPFSAIGPNHDWCLACFSSHTCKPKLSSSPTLVLSSTAYPLVRTYTDTSFQVAIDFCKRKNFDGFVAVGGGSVIDTAKAANVYMCNPKADFLDFVNAPIGKGLPIPGKLKPLIAVPTTAGTGSETTGVSIFDHTPTGAKTGIRDRGLRPVLGIIDPDHTRTCGPELTAFTGLDVLCHALESCTAVPYNQRITGAPARPQLRPAYQGSNSISDIWSGYALQQCSKYLLRAVEGDPIAREQMCLASTAAGVGFGSAGVHLCHAMSYPISSCVTNYRPLSGYGQALTTDTVKKSSELIKLKDNMVPHGLSVVLTAPAVFKWTSSADPERHLKAAELLGANVTNVKAVDSGLLLSDTITALLSNWTAFVPNGLQGVGYGSQHLETLVKGTLPQRKVIEVSPRQPTPEDFNHILENSMKLF